MSQPVPGRAGRSSGTSACRGSCSPPWSGRCWRSRAPPTRACSATRSPTRTCSASPPAPGLGATIGHRLPWRSASDLAAGGRVRRRRCVAVAAHVCLGGAGRRGPRRRHPGARRGDGGRLLHRGADLRAAAHADTVREVYSWILGRLSTRGLVRGAPAGSLRRRLPRWCCCSTAACSTCSAWGTRRRRRSGVSVGRVRLVVVVAATSAPRPRWR